MRISESNDTGTVLVVDDDEDSRDAVARYLTAGGYAVRAAKSGREALIAVASTVPDVIVLDVRMPDMDGIEFLQVIRSYLRWQAVPVVLLTAYAEGEHIARSHTLGVKRIFLKATYRLADLLDCVNRLSADPQAQCGAAG